MNIVGHKKQRNILDRLARKKLIPQSYLFSGPRGVGKKLLALEFASQLIGTLSEDVLKHPDLLILVPPQEEEKGKVKRKRISIGEMRSAQLFLSRYPTRGQRRALIIDEAEELTLEASNALLKILEEPNETSIIILITHRPGLLLPTVLSRIITFTFDLISEEELVTFFGKNAKSLPHFFFSLGNPGLIERALSDTSFNEHKENLGKLFQISRLTLRERLQLAEKLSQNEDELTLLLEEWLMGMHARVEDSPGASAQGKLLHLFDRLSRQIVALSKREGNTRLLLEEMFLAL